MKSALINRGLGALVLLFFTLLALATPASAEPTEERGLGYSLNGQSFTAEPPGLFAKNHVMVPGDRITQTLWIRNERDQRIEVNVRPVVADERSELYFETTSEPKFQLDPGQAAEVGLELGLPFAASNRSEDQIDRSAQVLISAMETSESPNSETPKGNGPDGEKKPEGSPPDNREPLGNTGIDLWTLPWIAGALLVGIFMLRNSRRHEQEDETREGAIE